MHRRRMAFAMLGAVQITLIAAISLVAVGLPAIQADLEADTVALTLVNAGYGLAFSGLLILGGRLGDARGPRRVFVVGMLVFALGSVAGAWSPSLPTLVASRFAQGAGAALAAPAALALAGELFADQHERERALAVWGGLSATGAVAGMLLSGPVVGAFGWRWVFAVPAVVAFGTLACSRALLPEGRKTVPERLDAPGAILVTASLSALAYGVLRLSDGVPDGWAWTGSGLAAAGLLAAVEARTASPLLPLKFFRGKERLLSLAAIVLAAAASAPGQAAQSRMRTMKEGDTWCGVSKEKSC